MYRVVYAVIIATCFVVGVLFVLLRIEGEIAWSWWYVLMPFIAPYGITIIALGWHLISAAFSDFRDRKGGEKDK